MFRSLLFATTIVTASAVLSAAEDSDSPTSPGPSFMFIAEVDVEKGEAISHYTVFKPVEEAVAVKAIDPATGKVVEEIRTETRYVAETRAQVLALGELQVITPSGKVVPTEEALKKMAGRIVVDARHGIDPRYLKLFKDDVLIVVPKEEEAPTEPGE